MTEMSLRPDTNQNTFVSLLQFFSVMTTNRTAPALSSQSFFLGQVIMIVHHIVLSDQSDNRTDTILERLHSVQYLDLHFLLT